ncbi:enoyl-CoA hydratase/isomerase family protein [Phytoactinopolyspora limicola]|uniref:enoyl-CoA hydratase/isomerase family protein n=1 Tax=Phytoactinopolyspora limicola TaxID=2715536 RepID=UPI00140D594A|nr:enoyl-CoA hydratase/isomerase family protein [Phytoactinopolyspora limicola]
MSEIEFEATEDGVGVITLNRPEKLNAFNFAMHRQLATVLTSSELQDLRAVVLTGSGTAFCAGTDLAELGDQLGEAGSAAFEVSTGSELSANFRGARPVIIAAVRGYALGLGTLVAMLADLVVCADDAQFGHPEITHGLVQGNGIPRLREVVGTRNAMSLLVTGRRIPAQEALAMGMVNEVVPEAGLADRARELATQIAGNSTYAVHMTKRFFYEAAEMPYSVAVQAGYRVMRTAQLARREQASATFSW